MVVVGRCPLGDRLMRVIDLVRVESNQGHLTLAGTLGQAFAQTTVLPAQVPPATPIRNGRLVDGIGETLVGGSL